MKKVEKIRKKHPFFSYKSFKFKLKKEGLKINFLFKIDSQIVFRPEIFIFEVKKKQLQKVGERVLNNFIFHLGLIEALNYWKATLSPKILIPAPLKKEEIRWWKEMIEKGMSQFFYENKISNPKKYLPKFQAEKTEEFEVFQGKLNRNKILVPIGGGKDSLVTLELLKKRKKEIFCFALNPHFFIKESIKIGKCKNSIFVKRKIDQKLLDLQKKGYLEGHIPFSANLAFLSVLLALLFDIKYIAFANERSSEEGNLQYKNKIINHQWSKTFEFEKIFRDYSKKFLAKELEYFSFLRSLYEIQIAKIFSNFPQYFQSFLSCNKIFKLKKPLKGWCNTCPKCLFVFTVLYPFLREKEILKIFRKNLFESENLIPLMEGLVDPKKAKPFECVGTKKEALIAFYLSWKKIKKEGRKLPVLIEQFEREFLFQDFDFENEAKKILESWDKKNFLPKDLEKLLKNEIKRITK